MQEIINLRHSIHQNPELAFNEFKTTEIIYDYLSQLNPNYLKKLDRTGLIAGFYGQNQGKNILLRTDIDAVNITENTNKQYKSINQGIAHSCGHDGHIAIMLSLAKKIAKAKFNGKIYLLFQPAEEIGEGAKYVLDSKVLDDLNIDYCYGYHNLPGVKAGQIAIASKLFCATSLALKIVYQGINAHASEPEKGISPAAATASIILSVEQIASKLEAVSYTQALIIYSFLGSKNFGIAPDKSETGITLRAYRLSDLELLKQMIIQNCQRIAEWNKLNFEFLETDFFPPVVIDESLYHQVLNRLEDNNFDYSILEKPFTWSEDFGYFANKFPSMFIGLGVGDNQANLHNNQYDFPDDLIVPFTEKLFKIFV